MNKKQAPNKKQQFSMPSAEEVQRELATATSIDDFFGGEGIFARLFAQTLEEMMAAELTEELGYERYEAKGWNSGNSRNGSYSKRVKTSNGEIEVQVPRDRSGEYKPAILRKYETSSNELEDKIVGMFGHSFGGATTIETLSRDARIRAGAVLDGSLWNIYDAGLDVPVLFMSAEATPVHVSSDILEDWGLEQANISPEQLLLLQDQWDAAYTAYQRSPTAYSVVIAGTEYHNFTDNGLWALVVPNVDEGLGPIDPAYALEIISAYLEAFFGQYLNDQPADLLTGTETYPEVELEFHVP